MGTGACRPPGARSPQQARRARSKFAAVRGKRNEDAVGIAGLRCRADVLGGDTRGGGANATVALVVVELRGGGDRVAHVLEPAR
jgi:hypothetical protein